MAVVGDDDLDAIAALRHPVVMLSSPPCSRIAWAAFVKRFTNTCVS